MHCTVLYCSLPGEDDFIVATAVGNPFASSDGPLSLAESCFLLGTGPHRIKGRNEVRRTIGQVSAARHGRLVNVHRVRTFKTGKSGCQEVYGNQVIVEENDNGVRVLKIIAVWALAKSQKVDHVLFHFQNGRRFPMNDRNAGSSTGLVMG